MSTASPRRFRVTANGLEHQVVEWLPSSTGADVGPGSAGRQAHGERAPDAPKTVVLVHGFMDAGGTWSRVAPLLTAAGLRVVAPDMRGFGDGARAPVGSYYHFVDYVFDLADLVDVLVPDEPFGLVGHSMGGTIATLYAGTFPERVVRFGNLEGMGPPDNPHEAGPARMRAWIDQVRTVRAKAARQEGGERRVVTFSREEALVRLAANHPNVPRPILEEVVPHLVSEVSDGRFAWHFDPLHRTTAPMPFFARLFVEFAKKITCPALFVSGGPLGYHPPDEDERVRAYPNVTTEQLPNAGHMMHWTEPDALGAILVRFLTGARA